MAKKKDAPKSADAVFASLRAKHKDDLFIASEGGPNRIPTRFLRFGNVLGSKDFGIGVPEGRIIEAYGPEGGYKTTMCLTLLADIARSKPDKRVVYMDHEQSLQEEYLDALGVMEAVGRPFNEWVLQPIYFEMGASAAIELARTGEVSVIVLDSLAALSTKAEHEAGLDKATIGRKAYEIGRFVSLIAPILKRTGTILLAINQLRVNLSAGQYGNPEKAPGGRALKHAAHVRLRVSGRKVKDRDDLMDVAIKFAKNKVTGRYPELIYRATRNAGFDFTREVLDYGLETGVITHEPGKEGRGFVAPNDVVLGKTKKKAAESANEHREAIMSAAQASLTSFGESEDGDGEETFVMAEE